MDAHRLAEARSLAYHAVIAARLMDDPRILDRARARVRQWLTASASIPYYAEQWNAILARPVGEIAAFLKDAGERATELRQSTPFAGALSAAERWEIWRRTKIEADGRT